MSGPACGPPNKQIGTSHSQTCWKLWRHRVLKRSKWAHLNPTVHFTKMVLWPAHMSQQSGCRAETQTQLWTPNSRFLSAIMFCVNCWELYRCGEGNLQRRDGSLTITWWVWTRPELGREYRPPGAPPLPPTLHLLQTISYAIMPHSAVSAQGSRFVYHLRQNMRFHKKQQRLKEGRGRRWWVTSRPRGF